MSVLCPSYHVGDVEFVGERARANPDPAAAGTPDAGLADAIETQGDESCVPPCVKREAAAVVADGVSPPAGMVGQPGRESRRSQQTDHLSPRSTQTGHVDSAISPWPRVRVPGAFNVSEGRAVEKPRFHQG